MKVLMLNGSPRNDSNIGYAFKEMEKIFKEENIDVEIMKVGDKDISGCKACEFCAENGYCIQNDCLNEVAKKFEEADALVVGSPVYYASANGTLISLLDRLFYSTSYDKSMKVGASVVCCRRGGASATFDELNKYFLISNMAVAGSKYWNSIHGTDEGEALKDEEGLQTMRYLARNIVFLMKSIALGREQYGLPAKEKGVHTNFIR